MVLLPSVADLTRILQICRREKRHLYVQPLHFYMIKNGLEGHRSLGNYLIPLLASFGFTDSAQKLFDRLAFRNHWSWNSLITLYAKSENLQCAISLYRKMQDDSFVNTSKHTFVALLQASMKHRDFNTGIHLHSDLVRMGIPENDPFIGTVLLDMYVKCGLLDKAREIFFKIQTQDVVSWNALISGYAECGHGDEALHFFERMQFEGICPDAITYVCSLKSCGIVGDMDKAIEIHAEIERKGWIESNLVIGNALIDIYARNGLILKAEEVFHEIPLRDVVSWTSLMAGYVDYGYATKALCCLENMQLEGIFPNTFTFVCSLKACGIIQSIEKGSDIHAEIDSKGLLKRNIFLRSTLIDMYAKFGLLAKAQELFDEFPIQNVVLWTSLIAGYAEHECGAEALHWFTKMQFEGIPPNAVTFICSLKACGSIGATIKGREIHADIERRGLERDIVIGTTLVDMYARCECLDVALNMFEKLSMRDYVSWNALITGYAQLGRHANVFSFFNRMIHEGVEPDVVTFLVVLGVCSQAGMFAKGQMYFEAMSKHYGIIPISKHYYCMIDLLVQTDQIENAMTMIRNVVFHRDPIAWCIALGACKKWGNVVLGREIFDYITNLDERNYHVV